MNTTYEEYKKSFKLVIDKLTMINKMLDLMINNIFDNKTDRKCLYKQCNVSASFNYIGKKKGLYCNTHKLDNMINISSKKCDYETCNKQPCFNYPGEIGGLYCAEHKLENMIDVKNKKCLENECTNVPSYGFANLKTLYYCSLHKKDDMINVRSKHCKHDNCYLSPCYNYINETTPLYCNTHKLENMIDVKNKKCANEDCNKNPNFNYQNEKKGIYCNTHKLENMIDVINKKCISCKITMPNFNYKNKKKAEYCFDCKSDDMIDVTHKMCQLCEHTRGDNNYEYMCSSCFYYTYPDHIKTRNHKTKENQIMYDLNKYFNNLIIQDKKIYDGCSRKRPDGLIKLNDYNIIIEVDENQHNKYSCENKRLMILFQDLGNSPLTVIRFNPDKYKLGTSVIQSPFGITETDGKLKIINTIEYNKRLVHLIEIIENNISSIPNKEINIIQLFYNEYHL